MEMTLGTIIPPLRIMALHFVMHVDLRCVVHTSELENLKN